MLRERRQDVEQASIALGRERRDRSAGGGVTHAVDDAARQVRRQDRVTEVAPLRLDVAAEMVEEMVGLIRTQRAYEINSKVINAADDMLRNATQVR